MYRHWQISKGFRLRSRHPHHRTPLLFRLEGTHLLRHSVQEPRWLGALLTRLPVPALLAPARVYPRKGAIISQEEAVDQGDHQVDHHTTGAEEEEDRLLHHRRRGAEVTADRMDQEVTKTHGGFQDTRQHPFRVTYQRAVYHRTT